LDLIDFDHADIYGSYTTEADFGAVLKKRPDLRTQIRITTKCGIKMVSKNRPEHQIKSYDLTKDHIKRSVENSLLALYTDHIDTLLLHRPDYLFDPHIIAEAFTELKNEGKVKYFGVSNFSVSQFELLQEIFPLCTHQVEVSLLHREAIENGVLDQCQKWGITPTAWSPLGGGALLKSSEHKDMAEVQKKITTLCEKHDAQMDQVLLAWLRKHPAGIVPVLGTSKLSRIKNAKDSLKINLTHEEWYLLWQAATGTEIE
jgi:predicted oxidoreductase